MPTKKQDKFDALGAKDLANELNNAAANSKKLNKEAQEYTRSIQSSVKELQKLSETQLKNNKGVTELNKLETLYAKSVKDGVKELENIEKNLTQQLKLQEDINKEISLTKIILDEMGKSGGKFLKNLSAGLGATVNQVMEMGKELGIAGDGFEGLLSIGKDLGATLTGDIFGPIRIILTVAQYWIKIFVEIDKTSASIARHVGISRAEAGKFGSMAVTMGRTMAGLGVTTEMVAEAATSLADTFGNLDYLTTENVKGITMMAAKLGMTSSEASKTLDTFMMMSGSSLETAKTLSGMSVQAAQKSGVGLSRVMKDISSNTETAAKFGGKMAIETIKASAAAIKMGLSIATIAKTANTILDIESSVEKQFEAEVLLGRKVNLEKARSYALSGDLNKLQGEVLKQVGSQAEYEAMLPLQRQALADAIGIGVDELGKMVSRQKEGQTAEQKMAAMQEKQAENIDTMTKGMASMGEIVKGVQASFEKLFMAVSKVITAVLRLFGYSDLADIIEKPGDMIGNLSNIISSAADYITKNVDSISKSIKQSMETIWKWAQFIFYTWIAIKGLQVGAYFMSIAAPAYKVGKSLFDLITSNTKYSASAKELAENASKSGASLSKLSTGTSSTNKAFSSFATGAKNLGKGIGSFISEIAKGIGDTMAALGKGIGKFAEYISKGVGKSIEYLSKGVGKGIDYILNGLGKGLQAIGNPKSLMGAAGLVIVAGSIWIAAKAFQEFGKVKWADMGKAAIAIVALTAAVFGIGFLLTTGVGAVMFAAGVAGFIGLGIAIGVFALGLKQLNDAGPTLDRFSKLIIDVATVIKETFLGALERIPPIINAVGNSISQVVSSIGNSISGVINSLKDFTINFMDKIMQANPIKIAELGGAFVILAGGLFALAGGGAFFGLANGLTRLFTDDPATQINKLVNGISNFTEDKLKTVKSVATALQSISNINAGNISSAMKALSLGFKDLEHVKVNVNMAALYEANSKQDTYNKESLRVLKVIAIATMATAEHHTGNKKINNVNTEFEGVLV